MADNDNSSDPCLICGSSTKGLHFQVSSCRACAAFFRRSLKAKKSYRCQKGTGNCDLTKKVKGKPLCRYCRMKKCSAIGMNSEILNEHLMYNKPSSIDSKPSLPSTPLAQVFRGQNPVIDWPTFKLLIMENLNKKVEVINNFNVNLTELQRIRIGFEKLVNYAWPLKEIKVITNSDAVEKQDIFDFYTVYLLYVAQMMTTSEFFMKLSLDDRFAMFKHFWINCQQIERLYTTCQIRGYDINDYSLFIDNKHLIDISQTSFTVCDMSEEEKKTYHDMNLPIVKLYHTYIAIPFKTMKVTVVEVVFILILVLWDVREIKNLSSEAVQMANDIIEKTSIEMHNYYTYEMNIKVYSERITKLTKIAHEVQRLSQDRRNLTTMGQMFNLFNTDLSGTEIMCD